MALGESDTDSVDSVVCGKRKRGEIQETEEIDSGGCGGEIPKIDSGGCGGEIPKIDSGGCGREIAKVDSGGGEIAKIDSGGEIAKIDSGGGEIAKIDSGGGSAMKEEKETRWVPEFEDRYNIFQVYSVKMPFEDESYDPTRKDDDYSSDEDGKGNLHLLEGFGNEGTVDETGNDAMVEDSEEEEDPYDREAVLKYIRQVRNSFGFDVDVRLPPRLVSYLKFVPADVSHPHYHDHVHRAARFAIEEINVDMEILTQKSKTYKAVEVVKAVRTMYPFFLTFLTLDMKEAAEAAAATTIQAIVYRPMYHQPWELQQWRVVKA